MTDYRKSTNVNRSSRNRKVVQTGQSTDNKQKNEGLDVKINTEELINLTVTSAIGAVVGTMVTRFIFGD